MRTFDSLKRYLCDKLDLDRTGGAVFLRDHSTLILADKSTLTSQEMKCIESRFPHVSYTVASCETSLSGFIVIFRCDIECDSKTLRSLFSLLLHLLCFVCVMH